MTVEFISELRPRPGGAPESACIRKCARALEDGGFDWRPRLALPATPQAQAAAPRINGTAS